MFGFILLGNKTLKINANSSLDLRCFNDSALLSREEKLKKGTFQFLSQTLAKQHVVKTDLHCLNLVNAAMESKMFPVKKKQDDEMLILVMDNCRDTIHQMFNPKTNTWSDWTTRDVGEKFQVAVVGDQLFVFGGVKEGKAQSQVECFSFASNQWKTGPKMSDARLIKTCTLKIKSKKPAFEFINQRYEAVSLK